jgi:hypothetical protein
MHPILAGRTVAQDHAGPFKGAQHLGKVHRLVREDLHSQFARLPLEPAFTVCNAPEANEGQADRQLAGLLQFNKSFMQEELGFDGADSHLSAFLRLQVRQSS